MKNLDRLLLAMVILIAAIILWLVFGPSSVQAQGVVTSPHPLLSERLEALEGKSPTLAAALDSVRHTPGAYLALHVTTIPGTKEVARTVKFDTGVLIYVDLDKAVLTTDELDVGIIHEVYGHAVPVLLYGQICNDPEPEEEWNDSCVAKREAVILAELGFVPRTQYTIGVLRR